MNGTISAVMRAIIDRVYPVGIIIDFAVETNPNTAVGCGTQWERMTDGRTLIASDAAHPIGWMGGMENVALGVEHIPPHAHEFPSRGYLNPNAGEGNWQISLSSIGTIDFFTELTGGGQPHPNMQPSLAVCRWKRVA